MVDAFIDIPQARQRTENPVGVPDLWTGWRLVALRAWRLCGKGSQYTATRLFDRLAAGLGRNAENMKWIIGQAM